MAKRSKVPSREEHTRLWAGMAFAERRRILRSVNKGHGLENRRDARVGVGVARQQQRYWRWAWIFGPLMGLVRVPAWTEVATTALLGAALMGALSVWRIRRAQRAERENLERLGVST